MIKTIVTRSQNDKLYNISKSLWSEENRFFRYTEFKGYHGALDYLMYIINNHNGIIVNADEDFFVCNEQTIDGLIQHMKKESIDILGVPDGEFISHRNNSKFNFNPFFTIINCDKIKTKIDSYSHEKGLASAKKIDSSDKLTEPFAPFLFWLYDNFDVRFFTDLESTDKISTIIKVNSQPIGIHSWYSRVYGIDEVQTKRIDDCIEWAILNHNK